MRPRFSEVLAYAPDDVVRRLQKREVHADCPCQLTIVGRHVEVKIDDSLRHTWSPQLTLEIEEHADGSELHGHFGPNPGIWTTFLAAYAFVACCMFFGGAFGFSQQVAGQSAWGLATLPAGLVLFGLIYCASLWGQHLAAEQMSQLVAFLHASVEIDHTGRFKRSEVDASSAAPSGD